MAPSNQLKTIPLVQNHVLHQTPDLNYWRGIFISRNKWFEMRNKWLFYEGNETFSVIKNKHTDRGVRGIVTIFHWSVEWSILILAWLESLDKLLQELIFIALHHQLFMGSTVWAMLFVLLFFDVLNLECNASRNRISTQNPLDWLEPECHFHKYSTLVNAQSPYFYLQIASAVYPTFICISIPCHVLLLILLLYS